MAYSLSWKQQRADLQIEDIELCDRFWADACRGRAVEAKCVVFAHDWNANTMWVALLYISRLRVGEVSLLFAVWQSYFVMERDNDWGAVAVGGTWRVFSEMDDINKSIYWTVHRWLINLSSLRVLFAHSVWKRVADGGVTSSDKLHSIYHRRQ